MPFKQRTKLIPVVDASGKETGNFVCVNDTRIRWRALFWWCAVFTLIVFFSLHSVRNIANDNKESKADVAALRISNCNTRIFLVSSRAFRLRSYHMHKVNARKLTGKAKQKELSLAAQDLAGAVLSRKLADNFAPDGCSFALGISTKNLTITTPKKPDQ